MKMAKQITVFISAVCMAVYAQAQGSLTPPGSPGASMKTLLQIEPRVDVMTLAGDAQSEIVITNSGSYYLSANLEVSKIYGIHIAAENVVLDLNGFNISHILGLGVYGIWIDLGMGGATIRNGTIADFGNGIWGDAARGCLFEKLEVSGCSSYGIYTGKSARLSDCRAHENPGGGIYAGSGSSLDGCTAADNGDYGIYADSESSLNGCTASGNQGGYGIYAGANSTLNNCTASKNQESGIYAGSGSSLNGCSASGNLGVLYGIYADSRSSLTGCTASNNKGDGISADSGSSLNGCTASGNEGILYGISVGSGSSVIGCVASNNEGDGVFAGDGSTVKNCTTASNADDGIQVSSDCMVSGNTCDKNGTGGSGIAGIHATHSGNRIDGNNVTGNERGIRVDAAGNLIVRNSASGNINVAYAIVASNETGTIQVTPVGAGAWDNFNF